jgi:hypothetical protein
VRNLLRLPFVHVRLFLQTPAAYWPVVVLSSVVGVAWIRRRRPGVSSYDERYAEWFLFAAGIAALLWFFHGGRFAWDQNADWQKEWGYLFAWKNALARGHLPYYMHTQAQGTERFLANLETIVAPHVVLLGGLDVGVFFLVHAIAVFAVGYRGLVTLKRELRLSLFAWAIYLSLFLFNGHVTAHLGIGHTQWVSYYLLPWVLLGVLRLARGDKSWRNVTTLAVTLAAMIMIGGWHLFVCASLFLTVSCVTDPSRLVFLARTLMMVGLLSAFRVLPALLTFGGGTNVFLGSFRNVWGLVDALLNGGGVWRDGLDLWEYDTYIGHVGFIVLCLGAFPARTPDRRWMNVYLASSAALLILSLDGVYQHTLFLLPGFVSERVVTRLAVLPVLALSLAGCVRLDSWEIWRSSAVRSVGCLLAAWFLVLELIQSAQGARPSTAGIGLPLGTDVLKDIAVDAPYFWALTIGAAISASAMTVVLLARLKSASVESPSN